MFMCEESVAGYYPSGEQDLRHNFLNCTYLEDHGNPKFTNGSPFVKTGENKIISLAVSSEG